MFLIASALAPILASCSSNERGFLANTTDMQPISPEELELIASPLSRPAYFTRHGLPPDGPLVIRHRVFGSERGLLTDKKIENVRFTQCSFEGTHGYGNDLTNVVFEECRFMGSTFTGEQWRNVRLTRCSARGRFGIAGRYGDVLCEDCDFRGTSQDEARFGHWADHFGLVGSFERSTFIRCKIENVTTEGSKLLHISDSTVNALLANVTSDHGALTLERCRATGGVIECSGRDNDFSSIRIADCQLGTVKFIGVRARTLDVASSQLNLFLGGTRFDKVTLTNSVFGSHEGLDGGIDLVGDLLIDRCRFEGRDASLRLCGETEHKPPPGTDPIAWSRYRTLTLRHTEVPKAELAYLQIGTLTLDHATLADTDLSHCRIGTLRLQNASLKGTLDLRDTTIRRLENNGLTNTATVTGQLVSTPGAPEPEVTAPDIKRPSAGASAAQTDGEGA